MSDYARIHCGSSNNPVAAQASDVATNVGKILDAGEQFVLIELLQQLPDVYEANDQGTYPEFVDNEWNKISQRLNCHIGILVSVDCLQNCEAAITSDLSFEQTVEDLAAELHLLPGLKAISRFKHLFVVDRRSVIYIHDVTQERRRSVRLKGVLYFLNSPGEAGEVNASPQIFVNALKEAGLGDDVRSGPAKKIADFLRTTLGNVVRVDIPDFVFQEPLPDEPRSTKRWQILDRALQDSPIHRINIAVAIVKGGITQVLNRWWTEAEAKANTQDGDLWEALTRVEYWNPRDRAPDFVTLGEQDRPAMPPQVRAELPPVSGRDDRVRRFCLAVPFAKFGGLIVAERDQIETFRGIERLLTDYCRDTYPSIDKSSGNTIHKFRHEVPLSIAVFAPPGAGKSFAVKEIARQLGYGPDDIQEFNVAQFRQVKDLDDAFSSIQKRFDKHKQDIKKYQADDREMKKLKPPLAFFDEFDCALGTEGLGWLKYFLAPMQDGIFGPSRAKIDRAIFVFAGGVHKSFEEFDPRIEFPKEELGYQVSEEYDREIKKFADRKGPDFISRLRAYIDIPEANAEPGHAKHFLRRAIQLRGLLENKVHFAEEGELAHVDEALIYALLTVDRYRHGVRSMEAVLRMCTPHDEAGKQKHLHITSLPERPQLNMHVNAEKFYVRLHRGRARMQPRLSGEIAGVVERIRNKVGAASPKQLKEKFEALAGELATRSTAKDATELEAELRVLEKLLDFETTNSSDAGS
jgi:hypothetical protein